jgi:hypothetical protein
MMENKVIIAKNARQTSRQAAEKAYPKSGTMRLRVYEFIIRQGLKGATDQEIQRNLNLSGDTVRPSRITLFQDGLIIDSGGRRKNANGNDCIVWRSVDEGMMF